MAREREHQNATKRTPQLAELSPPKTKPRTSTPSGRKLNSLPELRDDNSQQHRHSNRYGQHNNRTPQYIGRTRKPQPSSEELLRQTRPLPKLDERPKLSHAGGQTSGVRRRPNKHKLPPRVRALLNVGITIVIIGGLIAMLALRVFNYNALAVFLDNLHVGYITISGETTSESFHDDVIAHLEAHHLTSVLTTQRITVEPARWVAGRNITRDRGSMISQLARLMEPDIQIVARAIYVNNHREAIVRSQSYVDQIVHILQNNWVNDYTEEVGFTADWRVETYITHPNNEYLRTPGQAIGHMDRLEITYSMHVVQPGENKTVIARMYDTTANDIANVNNILLSAVLHPGDELRIRTRRPLLSVWTIDRIDDYFPIEIPVIETESPEIAESTTRIAQEGSPGEQRVSLLIEYVNGVEIRRETLEAEVTREPIARIVEVGIGTYVRR